MGGKPSKQEEMFLQRRWPELLESAMATDAELMSSSGSSQDTRRIGFRMSFKEWQALITLLDTDAPGDILSRLSEGLRGAHLTNPLIVITIHACCWFDGAVNDTSFAKRLSLVREDVQSQRDPASPHGSSHTKRASDDDAAESELLDMALDVLSVLLLQCPNENPNAPASSAFSPLSSSNESRSAQAVGALMAWSPKRPVATLAHAFIASVVAARHASPFHAEAAVCALRVLHSVMQQSPAAGSHGIAAWPIVARLEGALLRRQMESDAADFSAGRGGRWWRPSPAEARLSGRALSGMSRAERWEAVEALYVGQQHVWEALRTHFVSSEVFDAEKPTVIVLFGPSGFGKSEMAKRVAAAVHGVELNDVEASGKLVHIHLPSFCTKDSIYSLVDPPAAHVGEGVLLSALRRCENAVVVLDEFEKGTAEAIQNLWLSAFQKKGTLRSLKDASRSVSTVKTTFVLTCNIAAQSILNGEERYLKGTLNEQAAMRAEWTRECKEHCRATMHDPFVNRVDYFFPFVPYTKEEKRRFIELQLRRVLANQLTKGRSVYIAPRMVDALVARLHTFHASTIEGIVRPLLVEMVANQCSAAVLTVKERVEDTIFAVLPVGDAQSEWMSIPGAKRALRTWDEAPACESNSGEFSRKARPSSSNATERPQGVELSVAASSLSSALSPAPATTWEKAKLLQLDTRTEKELLVELQHTKDLLLEKNKEIAYLKEKVLQLEKIVALLLTTTLVCLYLLSLVVGTTLVVVMGTSLALAMYMFVNMPLELLLGAIRVLYGVLGPSGTAFVAVAVSLWLFTASKNIAYC